MDILRLIGCVAVGLLLTLLPYILSTWAANKKYPLPENSKERDAYQRQLLQTWKLCAFGIAILAIIVSQEIRFRLLVDILDSQVDGIGLLVDYLTEIRRVFIIKG